MLRRVGQWLWLFALACGVAGVCGLADLGTAKPAGKMMLVGPHAAGVALTAWASRRRVAAGLVAVVGSAAMAGLSWLDALDRQTEGFEWKFNNALTGAMCCGANWLVLAVVGCVALALSDPGKIPMTPPEAGVDGGRRAEPGAAPDRGA